MMWDGKKSVAQQVFYGALDIIAEKIKDAEPLEVFTTAVENVKPNIEVRSKRVGGASYQVPMQVSKNRQQSLAIRWILMACREKKGRPMHEKLAAELMAAYNREGAAITQPRERPPHGRRQQGLRPLRLVTFGPANRFPRRTELSGLLSRVYSAGLSAGPTLALEQGMPIPPPRA